MTKFDNDENFLILLNSSRKHSVKMIRFKCKDDLEKFSAKVWVCNAGQNFKMTKTSQFHSIHQENTCKSSLDSNLIILTDFHNFKVNEEKLQN